MAPSRAIQLRHDQSISTSILIYSVSDDVMSQSIAEENHVKQQARSRPQLSRVHTSIEPHASLRLQSGSWRIMSLAQHLTPDDGFEQSERDDRSSICPTETTASWRRMSYDAFASVETQVGPEPYQPNKASTLRRICTLTTKYTDLVKNLKAYQYHRSSRTSDTILRSRIWFGVRIRINKAHFNIRRCISRLMPAYVFDQPNT